MATCAFLRTDLQINRLTKSRERVEIKVFKIKLVISNEKIVVNEKFFLLYRIYKKKVINKAFKCSSTKNTSKTV